MVTLVICLLILYVYKNSNVLTVIPCINDEITQWDNIEYVEVYVDGGAVPPTFIVDDSREIKKLVDSIVDTSGYRSISPEKQLEGLCNLWVRFSNGVCVGTYRNVNQGYIDLELRATGGPFYKLPKKFRKNLLELLEQYREVLKYREALKEKVQESQSSDEAKQAMYVAIDHVDSIQILRDYPSICAERLTSLPAQYYEDVDEKKIDIIDWLITVGDPGSHNANFLLIDSETYEYLTFFPGA